FLYALVTWIRELKGTPAARALLSQTRVGNPDVEQRQKHQGNAAAQRRQPRRTLRGNRDQSCRRGRKIRKEQELAPDAIVGAQGGTSQSRSWQRSGRIGRNTALEADRQVETAVSNSIAMPS